LPLSALPRGHVERVDLKDAREVGRSREPHITPVGRDHRRIHPVRTLGERDDDGLIADRGVGEEGEDRIVRRAPAARRISAVPGHGQLPHRLRIDAGRQLLGKDLLLHLQVSDRGVGHLALLERLGAPAVGEVELHRRLVLLQRDRLAQPGLLAGAEMRAHLDLDPVRRNLPPHAANHGLVRAAESLGTQVDLGGRARIVPAGLLAAIAQDHAAARGPGVAERADGAGRLLDHDVDVGIAGPAYHHEAVARDRLIQGGLELLGLLGPFLAVELFQRRLGDPHTLFPDLLLLGRPSLAEDPHGGPLEPLQAVELLGQAQTLHVRLRQRGIDLGDLSEHLQGPFVQSQLAQVDAQEHQLQRALGEFSGRHHGPLDLLLGRAGRLQGQREGLVHPGLGLVVA